MATSSFNQFVSHIKNSGLAKQSHYVVEMIPPPFMATSDLSLVAKIPFYCEQTSFPEFALLTQTVKDAGLNREVVYDKAYGNVNMTFICDQEMLIKKFFDTWMEKIVVSKGGVFAYPDDYTVPSLTIGQLSQADNTVYIVELQNVYPKLVNDIQLSAQSRSYSNFIVSFTYSSWSSYSIAIPDALTEVVPTQGVQVGTGSDPFATRKSEPKTGVRQLWDIIKFVRTGSTKQALVSSVLGATIEKLQNVVGKIIK